MDLKTGLVGRSASENRNTDLIIAGGGPAAISASLYAARYGIDHLVLESYQPGGQAALTAWIENYPGIGRITGGELVSRMKEQAESWGGTFETATATDTRVDGDLIEIKADSTTYMTRFLIIATGAAPAKLGVPGEDRFYGRGVSYCATCDAPFFKGARVMVVGGGDSAVKEGLHLAEFASELTLVHRRDRFRAEPYLAEKLLSCGNCTVLWNSTLRSIEGEDGVESVVLDTPGGETRINLDGVFIYVGRRPATEPFRGLVELNEDGTVRTRDIVHTSNKNVFAAGDVTDNGLRQVVTAVSDGARAASAVFDLLQ
ncbi:MAG: FAD-dependent oxidoreductase [Candidatus Fermentibacteraceae bacterium]|nr:FAD-dependent oxidoreductase [Candidatus Fermentibacteraceae bacterium]MBN2608291.1 FAD-dependent oxidoreductase [Candidatus Fermentibacteraceae bacterium]